MEMQYSLGTLSNIIGQKLIYLIHCIFFSIIALSLNFSFFIFSSTSSNFSSFLFVYNVVYPHSCSTLLSTNLFNLIYSTSNSSSAILSPLLFQLKKEFIEESYCLWCDININLLASIGDSRYIDYPSYIVTCDSLI